jgi:hypothetical protein
MDSNRIKEIHQATAYPESVSAYQALLQVQEQYSQDQSSELTQLKVENERLRDIIKDMTNMFILNYDENGTIKPSYSELVDIKNRITQITNP